MPKKKKKKVRELKDNIVKAAPYMAIRLTVTGRKQYLDWEACINSWQKDHPGGVCRTAPAFIPVGCLYVYDQDRRLKLR